MDLGRPGHVFDSVVLIDVRRDRPRQRQQHVFGVDQLCVFDDIAAVSCERIMTYERNLIAGVERHEAVGLFVNEAHLDLRVTELLDDTQVRAVDVDGIVVRAAEHAIAYDDLAPAAGQAWSGARATLSKVMFSEN